MSKLSGVILDAADQPISGTVIIELVDPSTGEPRLGQLPDGKTVARWAVVVSPADGTWEVDLPPNDTYLWPTGTGYKVTFPADDAVIVSKGAGDETMSTVVVLDDTADPAAPAAVAAALGTAILRDGSQAPTADLPMGGNKLTGLGEPTAAADALRVAEVDVLVDSAGQGRQHTATSRSWAAALATLTTEETDVAPVLLVADSMGELSDGWRAAWDALNVEVVGGPAGKWVPALWLGSYPFGSHNGTPLDRGLDRRGAAIDPGDGLHPDPMPVASTVDLYYTAHPDGATVEFYVDNDLVDTVDTSLDETGNPAATPTEGQRWRSPNIAGPTVAWSAEVTGDPGQALWLEAVAFPPARGLDVHGIGRSPQSTGQAHAAVIAHAEAMVARGEPPTLVVLAADTAEPASTAVADVDALTVALRALLGEHVTIAHMIPAGHANWGTDASTQAMHAAAHRKNDAELGLLPVDLFAAMGPVWNGHDPYGWHTAPDYVHHDERGQAAACAVFAEVLGSRVVGTPGVRGRVDTLEGTVVDLADELSQVAATAAAAVPSTGGTFTGQVVVAGTGATRQLRIVVPPAAFNTGGFGLRMEGASFDSLRATHLFGSGIFEFLNHATGTSVAQLFGHADEGLRIGPRLSMQQAADATPEAGRVAVYARDAGDGAPELVARSTLGTTVLAGATEAVWIPAQAILGDGTLAAGASSGHPVVSLAAGGDRFMRATTVLPKGWATYDIEVWWAPSTAAAGNVGLRPWAGSTLAAGAVPTGSAAAPTVTVAAPEVADQVTVTTVQSGKAAEPGPVDVCAYRTNLVGYPDPIEVYGIRLVRVS